MKRVNQVQGYAYQLLKEFVLRCAVCFLLSLFLPPVNKMGATPRSTTWAERNPQKRVQAVRTRRKLTDAEKAGRKVILQAKRAENAALTADLEQYQQECDERLEELARKYSCKPDRLRRLLHTSSVFKKSQKANLRNAIVHKKAQEENAGQRIMWMHELYADINGSTDAPVGEKKPLREIQWLVRNDPELQDLSTDQEEELIRDLEEHRALKKTGAWASNLAAAQDVHHTVTQIHATVSDFPRRVTSLLTFVPKLAALAQRTGIYAFTFISRGHIDDLSRSAWYATGDCVTFIRDELKIDPWDLAQLFEHWACTQQKSE